jgi:hypothetical protein
MSGPSASEQAEAVSQYKQRPIAGGKKSRMTNANGMARVHTVRDRGLTREMHEIDQKKGKR